MEGNKIQCLILTPYTRDFERVRIALTRTLEEIDIIPLLIERILSSVRPIIETVQHMQRRLVIYHLLTILMN